MARRNTLEKEFAEAKFRHMYVTIKGTILSCPHEYILDSFYVKELIGEVKCSNVEKLERLCQELIDLHNKGFDCDIVPLYEYCWDLLSPKLNEHFLYGEKSEK